MQIYCNLGLLLSFLSLLNQAVNGVPASLVARQAVQQCHAPNCPKDMSTCEC
ncbi:hypothetical protein PGT21_015741 [Puccinia graminis f. sp. tritici]|uniref:Uncharacterized protein n=1 Tax=Puccinia graminis f. sp. tritici TaxID=56615 RepID=A0A5B0RYF3_PUCGR|nr:hypothetical protein PGT21_015741 [Puccinia graminis f. sp. tritici]KAA1093523.1 hypothetical protein PGTUg99_024960 [Puccinia graminis f. sp. tritici]KAA1129594.1 hypothetical protein PGTUg99_031232 [Puccinia graminis f. sp. tritici]